MCVFVCAEQKETSERTNERPNKTKEPNDEADSENVYTAHKPQHTHTFGREREKNENYYDDNDNVDVKRIRQQRLCASIKILGIKTLPYINKNTHNFIEYMHVNNTNTQSHQKFYMKNRKAREEEEAAAAGGEGEEARTHKPINIIVSERLNERVIQSVMCAHGIERDQSIFELKQTRNASSNLLMNSHTTTNTNTTSRSFFSATHLLTSLHSILCTYYYYYYYSIVVTIFSLGKCIQQRKTQSVCDCEAMPENNSEKHLNLQSKKGNNNAMDSRIVIKVEKIKNNAQKSHWHQNK